MRKLIYLGSICVVCLLSFSLQGQTMKGKVTNSRGEPVTGVSIWIQGSTAGTQTDEEGYFTLSAEASDLRKDTVVFTCLGFETVKRPLSSMQPDTELQLRLRESDKRLEEVTVQSRRPVSEEFSVQKISQLEIYRNPAANADPLKAVTLLPASTNTDESANPSLRGSSADRSRVIVNGVPVNSPVRFSQLNNIGDFSLFNTAMLSREYIYASNPPLAFGNSTAGVIEIETYSGDMKKSSTQATLSLGSVGGMRNQRLNSDSNYVQLYGNYGFGDALIGLNKKTIDDRLNSYSTLDGGVNLHVKTGKYSSLNLYSYITKEKSNYRMQMYGWEENAIKEKTRNFNILSFRYLKERNSLSISHGNDFSREHLQYGNLLYQPQSGRFYTTAGYKRVEDRVTIQAGMSHEYARYNLNGSKLPVFYYALAPYSPTVSIDSTCSQHRLESYLYGKWYVTEKFILSGGLRASLPLSGQASSLSLQIAGRYDWDKQQTTLIAAGKYDGFADPNYYNLRYLPQSAIHYSVDHTFTSGTTKVQGAVYYKEEKGDYTTSYIDQSNRRSIFGAELFVSQGIGNYFRVTGSYTYLHAKQKMKKQTFPAANSLPYIGKLSTSYENMRIGTFALSYMTRAGLRYTPVTGGLYNPKASAFQPLYGEAMHTARMKPYHRVDFTANKLFFIGDNTLIGYCAVNNLLNIRNRKERIYQADYRQFTYDYYDKRVIYFGLMLYF